MKKIFVLMLLVALLLPQAILADAKVKRPLEKITFIHYKKGFIKPESAKPRPPKSDSCYGFISGYARLLTTADIYINPEGSGLDDWQVITGFASSTDAWDIKTTTDVFGVLTATTTASFDDYADGRNEIVFGVYPDSNVIAVTRVWGYFSGRPQSRFISQFDILFNTNYSWGDVAATGDTELMDLENIAVHELGHALGLNDIYTASCQPVTMYGYASEGEVNKRTLEAPDIAGLQTLYGI
ncbi:hypothetical protein C4569_02965 [Candidatus Parcubacteria bacterium]|nr:MAG: hypothetical protein C4569_02965 [Candidatus Parcubacteria bacterium]